VSLLLYLEPVVSVVSAVLLLGEHLAASTLAGGALVLAGVFTASRPDRKGLDQRRSRLPSSAPCPLTPQCPVTPQCPLTPQEPGRDAPSPSRCGSSGCRSPH
jgi:hypothetical protein